MIVIYINKWSIRFDKNTFIIHQFILYNNSSDNQGSEINKNDIVYAF